MAGLALVTGGAIDRLDGGAVIRMFGRNIDMAADAGIGGVD